MSILRADKDRPGRHDGGCCAQVAPQVVLDVAGAIPPDAVLDLIAACESGSFKELQSAMTDLIADGYPVRACKPQDHD